MLRRDVKRSDAMEQSGCSSEREALRAAFHHLFAFSI